MKKLIFSLFLFTTVFCYSQEDAWVYFRDKPNAQYYFDNPLQMLSQRALDRRANQNISLDIKDVPIYQDYVDQIAASNGVQVKATSKWFNAVHVRGSISDIGSLTSLPFVDHVQYADRSLNIAGKRARISRSNSIRSVNKTLDTNVTFSYGNSGNQIQMLNAHLLHQQNYTGAGKIIAVMDAGFPSVDVAPPFQRLRDNNQVLGGYNFVDRNTNFYTRNSHGTLVLSTMGGYQVSQIVGTAPDANYYLFITEDAESENPIEESNWVEAAEMADSLGVDVITTSLGYFQYDNPNYSYTYDNMNGTTSFISKGGDIAFSKGMICVASAGNSGSSATNPHIAVPADGIHTLAVGAVKSDETYALFSSIGPSIDGRVKPDVMAQGQSATVATVAGTVGTASGTSFSGPIMAGAITSFWQAIPWATNQQVVDFVKQSADRYANPDEQFGYGIPDFQLALNSALLSTNNHAKGRFLVFPNPANDFISLSFPNGIETVDFSIYNGLGQLVFKKGINSNTTLSIESLSSGIYFYEIRNNTFVQSGKIIKN